MAIYKKDSPREYIGLEADKPADGDLRLGDSFYSTDSDIAYTADEKGILRATIRPYKVYAALVSQVGLNAPTVVVLENTVGDIVFTRSAIGVYEATSTALFTADKTSASISITPSGKIVKTSDSILTVNTFDAAGAAADGVLTDALVEVRVYI